ncbi:hypothetical protein ACFQI3_07850 [Hansschlegelia quercus]|uniref:Transmembrane protein n=1 Tax=Hansschlegelia quercus TaxID=2528245 RepID=A0A4Q9GLH6_9HYPH|nr:hypothetical protein [Hansschlegelia quercus]TBN53554.1 hypothetical protein EYR15_06970 [Hansschlegelia quercus]
MTKGFLQPWKRSRLGRLAWAAILVALTSIPSEASAHSPGSGDAFRAGLSIPAISHGEMALIDERLDEIIALARVQTPSDGPMRRLYNHYGVQFAYCLWGLAPGGVAREDSPFNACAHAYLAAAKQLLLVMSRESSGATSALAILDRLEARRRAAPEAGEICSSSGETFNTATIVRPRLVDIARDPASAIMSLAAMLLLTGGGYAVRSLRLRSQRSGPARG